MLDNDLATPDTESSESESLRDTLTKAFAESQDTPKDDIPASDDKPARIRDEAGKFSRQAQEPVAPVVPVDPLAPIDQPVRIEPPASWKQELKGDWDKLPDQVRKYINDREAEVHKGFTKFDEERTFGKQLKDVIQPYMPLIQSEGGNPIQAVQSLLNTAYTLRTASPEQKTQLFSQLAQQYGVNVAAIGQSAPVDPTISALQQQVRDLQGYLSNQQQQTEQQRQGEIFKTISDFGTEKPHFEKLRPVMAALIENGQASDLPTAYEQAFRAHPETSQEWLKQEIAKTESARLEATRTRTNQSRNAAVSVAGSPGSAPSATAPASTLREELVRQFSKAGVV